MALRIERGFSGAEWNRSPKPRVPRLRNPAEVAKTLGVSREVAERLMREGAIPSRNLAPLGSRAMWRTTTQYVQEYIESFRTIRSSGTIESTNGENAQTFVLERETYAQFRKRRRRQ